MAPKTPLEEPTHFAKINPNELIGVWLSLVERLVRDQEVAGSTPVTPTETEVVEMKRLATIDVAAVFSFADVW